METMAKNINEFVVDKVCTYLQKRDEELSQVRKKLEETKQLFQAYIEATDRQAYPIGHTFCKHIGCKAIYVSDNRDSDIYLNCTIMRSCHACNEMYCDLHYEDHITICTCQYEWQECCGCFEQNDSL